MTKKQLGELILSSQDSMYRVAKSLLPGDEDCADAIQNAIVKAFTKIHTLKAEQYAKTWLTRIVINECYGIMRSNRRVVSLDEFPEFSGGQEAFEQDYSELYQAISKLSKKLRIAVILYYAEDYSVKEIAEVEKTTESAVKNRLYKARQILRMELEQGGELHEFG